MDKQEQNSISDISKDYFEEQFLFIKSYLSSALNIPTDEIKISFPTLSNFYVVNNVYKSSWAIYSQINGELKLYFTGNFLIQGGPFSLRSKKSPFGASALSSLISIASTISSDASIFKSNWALDLNLFQDEGNHGKLNLSVNEYKEFLETLNKVRAKWLLYLSEQGAYDFVICEFSEPSEPMYFLDLENITSSASKVTSYFKPISESALNLFKELSLNTEFEGKFYALQPGTWLKDEVLIELENLYSEKFFNDKKDIVFFKHEENIPAEINPFK